MFAGKLQLDQVETAIITLGTAALKAAYSQQIDVDSIGQKDFNDGGDLIISPPCVRIRFAGAEYNALRDNQKLTYEGKPVWEFWCFEENLRSKAEERLDTLKLVTAVQDTFTGARLPLDGGYRTEPMELLSVLPAMDENAVVTQFYIVSFRVNGIAQFSGANAHFGGL